MLTCLSSFKSSTAAERGTLGVDINIRTSHLLLTQDSSRKFASTSFSQLQEGTRALADDPSLDNDHVGIHYIL